MNTITQSWQKPQIGSKFTGTPKGCKDTESGTYWEVLPKIQGDMERLQRGLLKPKPASIVRDTLPKLETHLRAMVRKFWAWC